MNYCILRVKKLKSFGEIASSGKHTFREIPTPNANPSRLGLNRHMGAKSSAELLQLVKNRLPQKRRKDAVLCLEYFIGSSPEWARQRSKQTIQDYLIAGGRWLERYHGEDNVVVLDLQYDETTPHLVVYVVPLSEDGNLCAKKFIGSRGLLSAMQTSFAKEVGAPFGLDRGIEGVSVDHTKVKQFYAAMAANPTATPPKRPKKLSFLDQLLARGRKEWIKYEAELASYAKFLAQLGKVNALNRNRRNMMSEEIKRKNAEISAASVKHHEEQRKVRELTVQSADLPRINLRLQKELDEARIEIKRLQSMLPPPKGPRPSA